MLTQNLHYQMSVTRFLPCQYGEALVTFSKTGKTESSFFVENICSGEINRWSYTWRPERIIPDSLNATTDLGWCDSNTCPTLHPIGETPRTVSELSISFCLRLLHKKTATCFCSWGLCDVVLRWLVIGQILYIVVPSSAVPVPAFDSLGIRDAFLCHSSLFEICSKFQSITTLSRSAEWSSIYRWL